MSAGGFGKRITLLHFRLHRAGLHHGEKIVRHVLHRGRCFRGVVIHGRPCDEERTLHGENAEVHIRDRAGRIAEGNEKAERCKAIKRRHEGCLAHPVINHRQHFPAGDVAHTGGDIFLRIVDDMVATMGAGECCFFFRACRADDGGTQMLCPLAGNEANAACRRMPEDRLTLLYTECLAQKKLRGEALQHQGCCFLIAHAIRYFDTACRGNIMRFSICTDRTGRIGDAITHFEIGDAFAHRFNDACAFHADAGGKLNGIEAGAVIGVDEVDADGFCPHGDFAGLRRAKLHLFQHHGFRPASLFDADGLDGCHEVVSRFVCHAGWLIVVCCAQSSALQEQALPPMQ